MIRYSILWFSVVGVMAYAWKDWFRALCILLVMLAVLERPDMPKTMFGVQGLNPFNAALAVICAAWFISSMREGLRPHLPWKVILLLTAYVVIMLVAFTRMILDPDAVATISVARTTRTTTSTLVVEYLINTIKWIIPGLLIMHGCRDRERARFLIICLIGMYFLLALQVIRQMPLSYALDGEALEQRALRVLERRTGYHRVDLAMVLAGAAWAPLAARSMMSSPLTKLGLTVVGGVTLLGLGLTGGRTGYVAWAVAGLALCLLRWRHYLIVAPITIALAIGFMPGIQERMLQGIDVARALTGSGVDMEAVDTKSVTSGRTRVWPYAIAKIREAPIFGFGRQAHMRTGLAIQVYKDTGEAFGHPHNAYLGFALDNGLVGLLLVLCFYALVLRQAARQFVDRTDPTVYAVGGMTLGLVVAFLTACMGSQSLYPTISMTGMWCAMGLCIRLWATSQAEAGKVAEPTGKPAESAVTPRPVAAVGPASIPRPSVALWPNGAHGRPTTARSTAWPRAPRSRPRR